MKVHSIALYSIAIGSNPDDKKLSSIVLYGREKVKEKSKSNFSSRSQYIREKSKKQKQFQFSITKHKKA